MEKNKLLVIVGPTGVGKTALSIELSKKFAGEVISGDSLQVYRKLNIGTAKITEKEKEGIPHFLIDVKEPTETYSAFEFKKEAEDKIEEITSRNKLPMIVGGTGMYIQSLLFDFQLGAEEKAELANKRRLFWENFANENGKEELWSHLESLDPKAAKNIHSNNEKRVIRAIEVFEKTGVSILDQEGIDLKDLSNSPFDVKLIGLETNRELLYERINYRVDLMMEQGLLKEAEYVFSLGDTQGSQGIGYKEFFPYFRGDMPLETCVEKVKQNSRKYAKRQLTWFKNRMDVEWFDLVQEPSVIEEIETSVREWLTE
ncbi:MAG: tRNA (adenosine(37)-N6)-dimethylallyltransferase MiaA [Vagococcus sp.]|uniref:tRNA (adenosine(37)-N6)-dimethylallyltransferase MiaA n=1 Tax=Vagococcus TaxID=2737 RepID=UPI002FCC27CF